MSDCVDNLAVLTPEEHYLAHQLLVKIYPDNHLLINAAAMMIPNRPSNKMYGWLKRRFSAAQSINQGGAGNSQFGTRWIHSVIEKKSKKIEKHLPLPNNWIEGRKQNFDNKYGECIRCGVSYTISTNKSNWCSAKCKKEDTAPGYRKDIDNNIEYLIGQFKINGSIEKTLREFGIPGVRAGNSYFSSILGQHNIPILKRRNSARI